MARNYTEEYKVDAVKLVREMGSARKAAKELGIPDGTLEGWVRKAKNGEIDLGPGYQTPQNAMTLSGELKSLREQVKGLEKENANLRKVNEFLSV